VWVKAVPVITTVSVNVGSVFPKGSKARTRKLVEASVVVEPKAEG